jgi:hypothetical protein
MSARQLSHFTLPLQSKQCHQRPLLCSRSVLECKFFDKSFHSCVKGCISNTAMKAFFVHFTYCLVIVYRTHITSVKNERFPPNHRPIEQLTTNYHGQSQPQTTQTQEAILLQSEGVRSQPETLQLWLRSCPKWVGNTAANLASYMQQSIEEGCDKLNPEQTTSKQQSAHIMRVEATI